MINVGVIGIGMMGLTHLDVYARRSDVRVVAISDLDPDRLSGKTRAAGNLEGQAQGGFSFDAVKKYAEGMELINDRQIDLVDICLPTPLHAEYAIKALRKGRHLLVEKPVARTARDARRLVAAAEKARGLSMCAMCMRFWPGWTWLKDAVTNQTYGKVLSAHFRRVAQHPGGPFYSNGEQCGGALLDLHIHDTDFVQYLFGPPKSVTSFGYSRITSEPDHVLTRYEYDQVPMVTAEGGWAMAPGFGFSMRYAVNFENATAVFGLGLPNPLTLHQNGQSTPIPLAPEMGYALEIDYFLNCLARGEKPSVVTLRDAALSVTICEAERKSLLTGRPVKVKA